MNISVLSSQACCIERFFFFANADIAVVIDNSSSTMRAGFAEDDEPRVIFPSVVGYPSRENQLQNVFGATHKRSYVGYEALEKLKGGGVTVRYPIQNGVVTNRDAMEEARTSCMI